MLAHVMLSKSAMMLMPLVAYAVMSGMLKRAAGHLCPIELGCPGALPIHGRQEKPADSNILQVYQACPSAGRVLKTCLGAWSAESSIRPVDGPTLGG
jgi:hypothetical protein